MFYRSRQRHIANIKVVVSNIERCLYMPSLIVWSEMHTVSTSKDSLGALRSDTSHRQVTERPKSDTLKTKDVSLTLWDSAPVLIIHERCQNISETLYGSYRNVVSD